MFHSLTRYPYITIKTSFNLANSLMNFPSRAEGLFPRSLPGKCTLIPDASTVCVLVSAVEQSSFNTKFPRIKYNNNNN